jgi:Zn-finger nucleic acid-binding protein
MYFVLCYYYTLKAYFNSLVIRWHIPYHLSRLMENMICRVVLQKRGSRKKGVDFDLMLINRFVSSNTFPAIFNPQFAPFERIRVSRTNDSSYREEGEYKREKGKGNMVFLKQPKHPYPHPQSNDPAD